MGTGPRSRPCATACSRPRRCWRPFTPFLADEIHLNLAGGEGEAFDALPDSVHLRDYPEANPALADPDLESAMDAVRLTVELGRAARAQAKAKVRQPLRRAVIVANDAEREAISARADLVTAELNVKELDFVSDEAELVSYSVKPNYRALGPRFGKRMPQVAASIEALDPEHVAAVMSDGGEIGINIDGDEHTISPDEVTLALQPLEGYEVEAEAGHAVALQLELDDELLREGLAREIVHAVQNARKEAGLDITDRIELTLGGDADLVEAAREHQAYLAGEVLATSVAYDGADGAVATIDGRDLRISRQGGRPVMDPRQSRQMCSAGATWTATATQVRCPDPGHRALEPARRLGAWAYKPRSSTGRAMLLTIRLGDGGRARPDRPGDRFRLRLPRLLDRCCCRVVLLVGLDDLRPRRRTSASKTSAIVAGMNRLRHAYVEIAPELEPYFVTGTADRRRAESLKTLGHSLPIEVGGVRVTRRAAGPGRADRRRRRRRSRRPRDPGDRRLGDADHASASASVTWRVADVAAPGLARSFFARIEKIRQRQPVPQLPTSRT